MHRQTPWYSNYSVCCLPVLQLYLGTCSVILQLALYEPAQDLLSTVRKAAASTKYEHEIRARTCNTDTATVESIKAACLLPTSGWVTVDLSDVLAAQNKGYLGNTESSCDTVRSVPPACSPSRSASLAQRIAWHACRRQWGAWPAGICPPWQAFQPTEWPSWTTCHVLPMILRCADDHKCDQKVSSTLEPHGREIPTPLKAEAQALRAGRQPWVRWKPFGMDLALRRDCSS